MDSIAVPAKSPFLLILLCLQRDFLKCFFQFLWKLIEDYYTESCFFRSSRSQMFFKIGVLRKVCDFIKVRLQQRYFPVKFVKFLRRPVFEEHRWWLLLRFLIRSVFKIKQQLLLFLIEGLFDPMIKKNFRNISFQAQV